MGKCKRCGKEVKFQSSKASFIMLHSACWETEVGNVVEIFCDKYCRFPVECKSQDELDEHCDSCEFVKLFNIGRSKV